MDIRGQHPSSEAAPDEPPSDGYLTFPKGTEIPIDLPPMCIVPGSSRDKAVAHAAALNTPLFPKLRHIILTDINRRIAAWQ